MSTNIPADTPRVVALELLLQQDAALRGMAEHWPYPRWIKIWHDGELMPRMAWINQAYGRWYNVKLSHYLGHCDRAVWDDATASAFMEMDRQAIKNPLTIIEGREPSPRGESPFAMSRKFAYRIDTDGINGWAIYGECTPEC
jgi:hypothetical protein